MEITYLIGNEHIQSEKKTYLNWLNVAEKQGIQREAMGNYI